MSKTSERRRMRLTLALGAAAALAFGVVNRRRCPAAGGPGLLLRQFGPGLRLQVVLAEQVFERLLNPLADGFLLLLENSIEFNHDVIGIRNAR